MPASLPPADPPHSEGICSQLWIAHRGDAVNSGERAEGDGDFDEVADDDNARTSTSSCSAHACLRHPFVRALADGSLPLNSFRFYVAQDFHFLTAFSRAYALAADAAAAAGDRAAAATLIELQGSVDEELGLHRGFAASWGVVLKEEEDGGDNSDDRNNNASSPSSPSSPSPLQQLPRPSAATTAYTSFLLETAGKAASSSSSLSSSSLAGVARALAAMAPCCRLYGWLGVKLAAREEDEKEEEKVKQEEEGGAKKAVEARNPFAAWIETYSSHEYHAATAKLEGLLDRLAEGLSVEERASLTPLFSRAMRLEHDFFTAAALLGGSNNGGGGGGASGNGSGGEKPLLPSLLVVDFDETLTAKDTTRLIIGAAASAASRRGDAGAGERARMEAAAAALVKRYVEDREALLERELPSPSSPPSSPFSAARAAAFLSKLSAFDREANSRVFDSGILAGIAGGELFELGKRRAASERGGGGGVGGSEGGGEPPLLRPGAAAALAEACLLGVPARVLSVSWSSELIRGALEGALEEGENGEQGIEVSCDEAAWGVVGGGGRGEEETMKKKTVVAVSANALEFDSSLSPPLSTGKVIRRVECADDKLEQFTALAASLQGDRRKRGPVVFVGDSPSDLGALLAADVGIIIADSENPKAELRRVAEALGVRVAPLDEAAPAFRAAPGGNGGGGGAEAAAAREEEEGNKTLFEARSWGEVRRLLFGGGTSGTGGGGSAAAAPSATAAPPPPPPPPPPHPAVPRILSIAGSDSGGGAGLQADLKAASALGVFSATSVTAVTVQNSEGVSGVLRVPAATVAAQAEAVLSDIGADAIKTGMLPDAETVEAVAAVVERWRKAGNVDVGGGFGGGGGIDKSGPSDKGDSPDEMMHRRFPLVVDPVLVSTSGDPLASGGAAAAMLSRLLPLATVVTPNLPEAAALLGLGEGEAERPGGALGSLAGVAEAARRLAELGGSAWVLVKGGHAVSGFVDDGGGGEEGNKEKTAGGAAAATSSAAAVEAIDVLFERSTGAVTLLRAPRVDTSVSHGTGCTLASALACGLARGLSVPAAARAAKRYVGGALAASSGLRLGRGPQFPMNHGYGTSACDWTSGEGLKMKGRSENGGEVDYSLYVVTDPRLVPASKMRAAVAAAVRGGATVVQVRDKGAGPAALAASSAEAVRGAADGAAEKSDFSSSSSSSPPVFVLVNDRVDVAAGVPGAAGAHVGQGDLPCALARRVLGHRRLLGVSVRTPEQAVEAAARGADYVGAGAVFPTGTKEDAAVIGLEGLAAVVAASPVPVVAIGGVTAENAGEAIRAGASGVAVVSAVFGGKGGAGGDEEAEIERAARAVRAAVDAALAERRR